MLLRVYQDTSKTATAVYYDEILAVYYLQAKNLERTAIE